MRVFNKVAIVGVGLIGGSLALVLKKKRLAAEVLGVSRRKKSIETAKKMQAIDRGSQSLDLIKQADLVVLALPIDKILDSAEQIAKLVKPGCVVTDVGSTKKEIVNKLERFFPNYIGSHPLAGSEKKGVFFANQDLFKDSLCILTPTK
ncbi:MAG: prephenate dehydrogenase/arogenate dehydrogenase family protein, partial [Candidatus Omnitrophota bacterium]